eukprot:TRINITY_DN3806_c0_g1_i1.p1 TRINITY_DN3806_c0_g1~~TRINITY_DN3806_c0_g1_i1.p1  ORF type:complete len:552 (+),score=130.10 TRINITY_DN3806_c0_g1_i1:49-1704(+)
MSESSEKQQVEVRFGGRRVVLPAVPQTYGELLNCIKAAFQDITLPINLEYTDDDGDVVRISSSNELRAALETVSHPDDTLHLTAYGCDLASSHLIDDFVKVAPQTQQQSQPTETEHQAPPSPSAPTLAAGTTATATGEVNSPEPASSFEYSDLMPVLPGAAPSADPPAGGQVFSLPEEGTENMEDMSDMGNPLVTALSHTPFGVLNRILPQVMAEYRTPLDFQEALAALPSHPLYRTALAGASEFFVDTLSRALADLRTHHAAVPCTEESGVTCHVCHSAVSGMWYRCALCDGGFDVCALCEAKGRGCSASDHPLIKIRSRAQAESVERRLRAETSPVAQLAVAAPQPAMSALTQSRLTSRYKCNFMRDVTVESGSLVQPGITRVKVWHLRNTGTEKWPQGCRLVYVRGQQPGVDHSRIGVPCAEPGAECDVASELRTPREFGRYATCWQLVDNTGAPMAYLVASYIVSASASPMKVVTAASSMAASPVKLKMPPISLTASVPAVPQDAQVEQNLATLEAMGFPNRSWNRTMLLRYGSIDAVLDQFKERHT